MSVHLIGAVLDDMPELGTVDAFVLLVIANSASEEARIAWPSVRTLARRVRVDERTVRRSLRRLESLGYIETAQGGHQYGRNTASTYRVLFDRTGKRHPPIGEIPTRGAHDPHGGAQGPHKGGASVPEGGRKAPPSVIETPFETRGAKRAASKEELARAAACLSDEALEQKASTGTLTAAEEFEREHRRKTRRRAAV